MTTTPQAALLREAAQNALITLDGIADTNPRDTADFETPAEWIAWAKSRARWAADALRAPIAQEIYAERILRKMLHESDQSQATHQCGTCGHIGIEDPVKGCPKCGFDDMRAKLQATQEPVQVFPPRIMELLEQVADRNPGAAKGPWEDAQGLPMQEDADAAISWIKARSVATQDPVQAGELPDEREAFEQWWRQRQLLTFPKDYNQSRLADWGAAYKPAAKDAWQARAALSARKPLTPLIARQLGEWHEDDGPVMWWAWNGHGWAGEPAWCGQPTDSDWPGYHTHWTPHPQQPATNGIGLEVKP